ncbi:hypothetical protein DL96DRAFT_1665888 [Flagelloscypha sp. PMI_526]|nr:hypothetical protein DL96DRAFT_1665888 [Flagelloscypha sp. PMI_526]
MSGGCNPSRSPDYVTDPDSVLRDKVTWRFGRAPDYTMNRRTYAETKSKSHATDSIEHLVENLVKNWEVEASHKPILEEWRTIDPTTYTFSVNGGPSQTAKHMLQVGTYNAIISPNSYYSPENSSFETSHKTFKRMMPSFAWEVLEVYSPPPVVAFRWRHWGTMKSDYVGYNDQGCRIRIKAHGGQIDIQGVTVAKVNDKFQITSLETWFDPLEMFAQMRPDDKTLNVEFDDRDTPEEEDFGGPSRYRFPITSSPGQD